MPLPGKQWWHIVISTYASWLPGNPRGFRSKKHKIHSSGDYKNPPPAGEHQGLHAYSKRISGDKVILSKELRPVVGQAMLARFKKLNHRILALSVSATHTHILVELDEDEKAARHVVGQCKSDSALAVRKSLPGGIWALRGKFERIKNEQHHRNTYHYILNQGDAWVWSFKDGERVNP